MTCYQRQMGWLFESLDLEYDKTNRRRVDDALRVVFGLEGDVHCPEVWAAIKGLSPEELEMLSAKVAQKLK